MSYLIKPEGYKPLLDLKQTELGIKQIKEFFQLNLSSELRLRRVTAPLFVLKGMGINDDLNGVERAVSFPIKDLGDAQAEVVHSLAKWKRLTLADYNIESGYGIYTDMNAIRSDEELGNLHSLYVDQWDWERVITTEDRNVNFLKEIVTRIYAAMIRTEYMVYEMYPQIKPCLPQKLHFIHAEELRQLYPNLEPKCREHAITKKYGAVFIIGIGCKLSDGEKHDGRARADIIVFGTAQPFVTGRIMIEKSPENQPDETDGAGQDECPLPPPMNGDPGDQQRRHDRADHRARIIKSGGQCPFLLREPFGHRFISCREVARFADTQQSPGNCKACGSGSKTVQYGSHAPDG